MHLHPCACREMTRNKMYKKIQSTTYRLPISLRNAVKSMLPCTDLVTLLIIDGARSIAAIELLRRVRTIATDASLKSRTSQRQLLPYFFNLKTTMSTIRTVSVTGALTLYMYI